MTSFSTVEAFSWCFWCGFLSFLIEIIFFKVAELLLSIILGCYYFPMEFLRGTFLSVFGFSLGWAYGR